MTSAENQTITRNSKITVGAAISLVLAAAGGALHVSHALGEVKEQNKTSIEEMRAVIAEVSQRVAVIEDSRYTNTDASEDKAETIKLIKDEFKPVREAVQHIAVTQAVLVRDVEAIKEDLGR